MIQAARLGQQSINAYSVLSTLSLAMISVLSTPLCPSRPIDPSQPKAASGHCSTSGRLRPPALHAGGCAVLLRALVRARNISRIVEAALSISQSDLRQCGRRTTHCTSHLVSDSPPAPLAEPTGRAMSDLAVSVCIALDHRDLLTVEHIHLSSRCCECYMPNGSHDGEVRMVSLVQINLHSSWEATCGFDVVAHAKQVLIRFHWEE